MRKFIPVPRPFRFVEISWRDLAITLVPILIISLVAIWAAFRFANPAPPDNITITSGPEGSTFQTTAKKYQKILARSGVKLRILPSGGSLENLNRLNNPSFHVDVGFVQGGVSGGMNIDKLVSLGSIFHEPLDIFYRGTAPVIRLSELSGRRLAIGPEGSGTRFLALALLKANGIEPGGSTVLLDLSGEDAAQALIHGKIDAAFLMGDSATVQVMRELFLTPGVRLMNFEQAEAYIRRFPYLNALELPMGSIDLGKNIPEHDVSLIAPTVELIAREDLHPALSDLLIEAAHEVHASAGLLRRAGEFPAPLEHEFRVSDDAKRYYTSGKSFLYRHLPFWVASLVDRMLVILVPIVVLLIPGLRMTPTLYRWRIRSRINRWYGALLALERDMRAATTPEEREELLARLDDIQKAVTRMKMPRSFADQFYGLRGHIIFVRGVLTDSAGAT
ncbi:MAG TPA: TAXI family TRAP transporter solute-binding subunit [Burkholderiales bacterium]|nr:TAXI family TRAP transporter solute-binding subunit [Burkholderiales bacterium]